MLTLFPKVLIKLQNEYRNFYCWQFKRNYEKSRPAVSLTKILCVSKRRRESSFFTFYDCRWYDQWEQVVYFLINEMKQKSGANEVTNELTGSEDRGSLRFLVKRSLFNMSFFGCKWKSLLLDNSLKSRKYDTFFALHCFQAEIR